MRHMRLTHGNVTLRRCVVSLKNVNKQIARADFVYNAPFIFAHILISTIKTDEYYPLTCLCANAEKSKQNRISTTEPHHVILAIVLAPNIFYLLLMCFH